MDKIKLGFVPTRRSIFSAPDAIKYRGLTADRLREIGVEIVDIDDINDEGLLFDDSHIAPIVEKFRAEGVDGIMLCHANFGTEYVCARLARELGLPVLLWGPRDERPEPDGTRLRDSQCGLFATGKVLRRFQVPFTYMTNCRLTDPEFERGVWDFWPCATWSRPSSTPASCRWPPVRSISGRPCATRASCSRSSTSSFRPSP